MKVHRESYPDHSSWDPKSAYYDPKCKEGSDKWVRVDMKFKRKFDTTIPLKKIQQLKQLENMCLVKRARLSVQPVKESEFSTILTEILRDDLNLTNLFNNSNY